MALELLTDDTLVVVLDTHRPSMLPCPQLAERAAKVMLIDHHRRSTEFLQHCSLMYHEPYASSTCEMATELLEYMDLSGTMTTTEAECLYTGILMDTKNFIIKTGVRTFEAASYLRRLGLNTIAVKKLFNINKEDYDHKVDIVKTAVEIAPDIAVAKCYDKFPNIKVVASQAADEMLNINNIRASIVVYPLDGGIGVSARSIGNINVQIIMEMLGGGGHMTVAGAQIKDRSIDMAVEDVKNAVNRYLNDK
jgi:c-di-AMP phosphodiesterase-like protein